MMMTTIDLILYFSVYNGPMQFLEWIKDGFVLGTCSRFSVRNEVFKSCVVGFSADFCQNPRLEPPPPTQPLMVVETV